MLREQFWENKQLRWLVAAAVLGAAILLCALFVLPPLREFFFDVLLLIGIMTPLWLIPLWGTEER